MGLLTRIRWGRVLLATTAAAGLWQIATERERAPELTADQTLLTNRPWIDRLPRSERDVIGHLVFLDAGEPRTGAVGRSSTWQQSAERFQWVSAPDHLTLTFPQSGKTGKLRYEVRACTAPEPMNLCLKIGPGRAAPTLYSSTEWTLDRADADAVRSAIPIDPETESESVELKLIELMEPEEEE